MGQQRQFLASLFGRAIDSRHGIDHLIEMAGAQGARVGIAVSRHRAYHTRTCPDKERLFCVKRTILRKTAIALVGFSIKSNRLLTVAL